MPKPRQSNQTHGQSSGHPAAEALQTSNPFALLPAACQEIESTQAINCLASSPLSFSSSHNHKNLARILQHCKMQKTNEEAGGELNAHLAERFVQSSPGRSASPPPLADTIPAGPSANSNEIQQYFELARQPVTGGTWLTVPEIPTSSEILRTDEPEFADADGELISFEPGLRPHTVKGPYASKEEYLGITYGLLREDSLKPFRDAVAEVRASPYKDESEYNDRSIGLYDPVYLTALVFSPRGLATRVAFSLSRVKKHIRWDQSKRLITGSLVALSPEEDAFKTTCILATVAARPISALSQNPPELDLFFGPDDQPIDPMQKYMMVESRSTFFEASRHTLLALQHMMREPFPMSEHLVNVQKEVEPPSYIARNPYMSLSSLVSDDNGSSFKSVDVLQEWPDAALLSLDESQNEALKRIVTSKLAIVQGPPGTGKTYVSVQAIKVLLANMQRFDTPIIVTAQTNHAVDQMMRHIMTFEPNIVRLGGRSKDKEVIKKTLFELRMSTPLPKKPHGQKSRGATIMQNLTNQSKHILKPLEANKLALDHKLLLELGLITQEQAESLELDSECTMGPSPKDNPGVIMEQWLGKSLVECTRPLRPDDYGWGFEEEELEVEVLQELEAEAKPAEDDDHEILRGTVILLCDNYEGKGLASMKRAEIAGYLQTVTDLTTVETRNRGPIYNYFKREVKRMLLPKMRDIAKEYSKAVLQRKIGAWEEDARILRRARVIGCTTTGLSKYRALLSAVHPRVIMVEEAAETLEAPVTVACMPSLQHLILVGDHQQLRPHTQTRALEDEPYFYNLSLFERLTINSVAFSTLTRQRRMKPEFRQLLRYIYGDVLQDHESVTDPATRPPVEGMGGISSFYFCHSWREERDNHMSCINKEEAKMVVGFVDYLVLNGIEPAKITILTFYNGQRKCLLQLLRVHQNLRSCLGIKVVTVDGYQGEENDIVILSLVRSNANSAIGFLSSENRACVALSRARRGFYLFGNAQLMACESNVWASVTLTMYGNSKTADERRLGFFLPVQCTNHGAKTWIEDPRDWEFIQGGCGTVCGGLLPCNHKCPYRCHPFSHELVNCMQKCDRVLPCKHHCAAICSDPCKCQICDQRPNGMKSMLKRAPIGGSSKGSPVKGLAQLRPTPEQARTANKQWTNFANGGAAADDARLYAMRKEDQARYAESARGEPVAAASESIIGNLIDLPSAEPDDQPQELLIDFSEETESGQPAGSASTNTPLDKGKGKAQMPDNLLD